MVTPVWPHDWIASLDEGGDRAVGWVVGDAVVDLEEVEDDVGAPAEDEDEDDDEGHLDRLHFGLWWVLLEDHYLSKTNFVTFRVPKMINDLRHCEINSEIFRSPKLSMMNDPSHSDIHFVIFWYPKLSKINDLSHWKIHFVIFWSQLSII